MSNPFVILCPGQGAQAIGMGKQAFDASQSARDVFDMANAILGFDIASICFTGPEDRLNQTDMCQPAIYVASIASFSAATEKGDIGEPIRAMAGLSLGEYTALHLAGVFSFEEGLGLVAKRGKYMQEVAEALPGGMVALIGSNIPVLSLCEEAAGGDVLVPANYNAPGQVVVSGSKAACQRLLEVMETRGVRGMALKVAGAFHSSLMQSAAEKMREELAAVAFAAPAVDVYSNVNARPHSKDGDAIKELLVRQIVSPVLWEDTVRNLWTDEGANGTSFVELAPGRTLAGLARRVDRKLVVRSLE